MVDSAPTLPAPLGRVPITITLPQQGNQFGFGSAVSASSDFDWGANPDYRWRIGVITEGGLVPLVERYELQHSSPLTAFFMSQPRSTGINYGPEPMPVVGEQVTLEFEITDGLVIGQVAQTTVQWNPTFGLGNQAYLIAQSGTASGGFTQGDRDLLTATERRSQTIGEPADLTIRTASGPISSTLAQIFSRQALDTLTLAEITTGPTPDPVRALISEWWWGIIIRVTTIPEDMVPRTPDEQWYFPDLAVLRIFRGTDLEYRRGIHTPTFMQEQPWQWGWNILNTVPVLGVPPETTIAVDWRLGCAGQVFLQRFP